jgi:histidinol-phosphate/aromatic aminotransferase/cobyric acid decarboxylase-like protein
MHGSIDLYDYSLSRIGPTISQTLSPLYLDYNEYFGIVHDSTKDAFHEAKDLLTQYHRPGSHSLENLLASSFELGELNVHLVSGADHALEEILVYCRNHLNLSKFYSYHETTYDHFYTFTQKYGFTSESIESAEVIYLCCPNNPDGALLSPLDCANFARNHENKVIIFDLSYLAYSEYSYSQYANILSELPNTFMLSSLAKIYPIAGLRAGWMSTTMSKGREHFRKFLNAKMINPVSRKILQSCLMNHEFYMRQTKEIFSNRKDLAELLLTFLSSKGITSHLKYKLDGTGGNFISLELSSEDKVKALDLLDERNLFVRQKPHWDFMRITSVNDIYLNDIKQRLHDL